MSDDLIERLNDSIARICKMCSDGRPPRMSIPAQPEYDDDLVICRAIRDAVAALVAKDRETAKAIDDLCRWRSAFQAVTPGGSEFMNPEGVREWAEMLKREMHEAKVALTLAERRAEAAEKNETRIQTMLNNSAEATVEVRAIDGLALISSPPAGKGSDENCIDLSGAKQQAPVPQQVPERSPADFAIEFGEYLAKDVEAFLNFLNETGIAVGKVATDQASMTDHWRGLQSTIYEFRKRAAKAFASEEKQQAPGVCPQCGGPWTAHMCSEAKQQAPVAEGWQWVPKEPTDDELAAAWPHGMVHCYRLREFWIKMLISFQLGSLAASPTPPGSAAEERGEMENHVANSVQEQAAPRSSISIDEAGVDTVTEQIEAVRASGLTAAAAQFETIYWGWIRVTEAYVLAHPYVGKPEDGMTPLSALHVVDFSLRHWAPLIPGTPILNDAAVLREAAADDMWHEQEDRRMRRDAGEDI